MSLVTSSKKITKKIIQNFGFDIQRHIPNMTATGMITNALKNFEVDLVLDVGANTGQFVSAIRDMGYVGDVISFEPLYEAHAALQKRSLNDANWIVFPRCAVGATNGKVEINIAGNSVSSSLLPMLDSHIAAAPLSGYVGKESVSQLALDSFISDTVVKYKNPLLKIDTQGSEWEVLNGAQNILANLQGILLEMSLVELYEGQHLWQEMMIRLDKEGFSLWTILPGLTHPDNGRTLQFDGIFFRKIAF